MYPNDTDENINKYIHEILIGVFLIINRFARNAIIKTNAITILTTSQVLPYTSANSVIPLVSISIKPAPKKKQTGEKVFLDMGLTLCIKTKDETNIKKIINR